MFISSILNIIRGVYNVYCAKHTKGLEVKVNGRPYMRLGTRIKTNPGSKKMIIGERLSMDYGAQIRVGKGGSIVIGNNCYFNCNTYITACGNISIGDHVLIGPNVAIFDHDHKFRETEGLSSNQLNVGEIQIGNNVWIGANSVILKGAKIGDGVIIAAGSVINKNIPPNSIIVQKRESTIVPISR